ncbi:MAG: pseudouridine synthase [Pseudomonadota bacterium]
MFQYFILNKPPGCITGRRDPEGRPTVYAHVPAHFPSLPHVGRLDFNTEGLLLFTDDGRLARALLDPGFGGGQHVEKVYHVKVRPPLEQADPRISGLERPLPLPSGALTAPARARWLAPRTRSCWIEVVITEGRHHQVRLLCAREGLQIVKLRRVSLGPLALGELRPRWCRFLTADEIAACYTLALPSDDPPRQSGG